MTIQRQYILPNCSLILDGLSTDASNVLSVLANAEFKIVGVEESLAGGSDFFKSLAEAVSAYCQSLLSGVNHSDRRISQAALVAVEPGEGQYHRLLVKPEAFGDTNTSTKSETQAINLSTVQLFDMAEAIDQFHADAQTLPAFSMQLAPLSRKYVRPDKPLVQRVIPPILGGGTLVAAALGLFFLPVPELADPEVLEQETSALVDAAGGDDPEAPSAPSASETNTVEIADESTESIQTVTIADSAQLGALQQQLQLQLRGELVEGTTFEQPLRYQVSVADNGDILAYNHLDEASLVNVDSTPLPELTYIPVEASTVEPVAQFEVTFAPDGRVDVASEQLGVTPEIVETETSETLEPEAVEPETVEPEAITPEVSVEDAPAEAVEVEPSEPVEPEPVSGGTAPVDLSVAIATPIQDVDSIYELNAKLRRTIIKNRDRNETDTALSYRFRLDDTGNITGYEADDTAAEEFATAIKLPDLVQATDADQPQLDFLVVINESEVVEVSPWDGWP